jgi:EAL domain-containing protein (putative c-di-GMP-specific phosphodiesterase class I)
MDDELKARAALEAELRDAIANGEIRPHYQPLVSLEDQELLGFEILSRWYHPTRGVLSPDSFIDIAEDTGLITDLSYGVLREACIDARSWPAHLRLALNISPYQLRDRALPQRLLAILTETGFSAGRFEVEITETALATDLETARIALTSLQNCGVKIALDDFGTGYSSLYHLRELRFDKIKIDRSFVQALNRDRDSTKIVDAIINLGKSLGLLTTAEGIENTDNRDWLKEQGCTFGQGYLFGAAMSAKAIGDLVADQPKRSAQQLEVIDIAPRPQQAAA